MDSLGLIGKTIAEKYVVERVVGQGGFGIVYRATHMIWQQPVALKFFTALSVTSEDMRAHLMDQFVQEGKLMADLSRSTSAVVQARDIGLYQTESKQWLPYTVLEWLDGSNLEEMLAVEKAETGIGRKRSLEETWGILSEAAKAITLAHMRGVAHRDIKPANIFVCAAALEPGVSLKLLDFGIAKVMQGTLVQAQKLTGVGPQSFTPGYAAPEQFDRRYGATGPWTDVYSFALVILELASGIVIHDGRDLIQIAVATQDVSQRPTPRKLGIQCTDRVEAIFNKALALDVKDRYAELGEFWNELSAALGKPVARSTTTTGDPLAAPGSGASAPRVGQGSTDPTVFVSADGTLPSVAGVSQSGQNEGGGRGMVYPGIAAAVLVLGGLGLAFSQGWIGGSGAAGTDAAGDKGNAEVAAKTSGGSEGANATTGPAAPPEPVAPCPDDMVEIPGGPFFMGSDNAELAVLATARPAHKVEVVTFCMDKTEVRAKDYLACSNTGKCKRPPTEATWPQGSSDEKKWKLETAAGTELCTGGKPELGEHPINCLPWQMAVDYCAEQGKRLPTEMEWELAARGHDGRIFPWGDTPPSAEHLNACGAECTAWRKAHGLAETPQLYDVDDGFAGTAPVGSFTAGATQQGLLDMTGNVFEWTADTYAPYPGAPPEVWAKQPEGDRRVIRGGAFNSFLPQFADPALRFPQDVSAQSHGIGFRCAREVAKP